MAVNSLNISVGQPQLSFTVQRPRLQLTAISVGGTGTVTNVSATSTATPLSITVTNPTSTPALALSWGIGQIPRANIGSGSALAGTYVDGGTGAWTPLALSGTGNASFRQAYALPATAGAQTGSFQRLAFSDLSGAPFTLTTTGTSGAATFTSGTLNIPQYSGGGGTSLAYDSTVATFTASGSTTTSAEVAGATTFTTAGTFATNARIAFRNVFNAQVYTVSGQVGATVTFAPPLLEADAFASGAGIFNVTGSLTQNVITDIALGTNLTGVLANGQLTINATGGGGGGVTQIVAGTNVTISPAGGIGVVTVNASGDIPLNYDSTVATFTASGSTTTSAGVAGGTTFTTAGTFATNARIAFRNVFNAQVYTVSGQSGVTVTFTPALLAADAFSIGATIFNVTGTLAQNAVTDIALGTGLTGALANGQLTIGNGGVTQIVAGTNVTVSPAGGTGVVTINSTGGGGGGGGTGWTSPANIAVGDIVIATDLSSVAITPGTTIVFNGADSYLKNWALLSLGSTIGVTSETRLINNLVFAVSSYTANGISFAAAPFFPQLFSNNTYYAIAGANLLSSTDLIMSTSTVVITPPVATSVISDGIYLGGTTLVALFITWNSGSPSSLGLTLYSSTQITTGWTTVFSTTLTQSTSTGNTGSSVLVGLQSGNLILIGGIRYSASSGGNVSIYSTNGGTSYSSLDGATNIRTVIAFNNAIYGFGITSTNVVLTASGIQTITTPVFTIQPYSFASNSSFIVGTVSTGGIAYTSNGTTWTSISLSTLGFSSVVRIYFRNNQFELWGLAPSQAIGNQTLQIIRTTDFVTFTTPIDTLITSAAGIAIAIGDVTTYFPTTSIQYVSYRNNNLVTTDSERKSILPCSAGTYRYLGGGYAGNEDGLWVRTA